MKKKPAMKCGAPLGQHFLRDRDILESIAGLLPPSCLNIVEIGAGPGNLTELLCQSGLGPGTTGLPVIAIEIDEYYQRKLKKLPYPNLNVLGADVLELFSTGRFPSTAETAIFGNLPYYISKEIFRQIFSHDVVWAEAVVLVQWEVARRLTSQPGSREYGILTIFREIFSEARLIRSVPASAFTPPPRVESAVVHLVRRIDPLVSRDRLPGFSRLVKTAFVSRRKFIVNNLIKLATREHVLEILSRQDIDPQVRPENVTIEQYLRLYDDLLPYLE